MSKNHPEWFKTNIQHIIDIDIGGMSVDNLNSTSNRNIITNVISTSYHQHFLDIDHVEIGCMSVHNLNSTSKRHLIRNVISSSNHIHFLD